METVVVRTYGETGNPDGDIRGIAGVLAPSYVIDGTGEVDSMTPEELLRYLREVHYTDPQDPMLLVADAAKLGETPFIVGALAGYVLKTEVTERQAKANLEVLEFDDEWGGRLGDTCRKMLHDFFVPAVLAAVRKIQKRKKIPAKSPVLIKFLCPKTREAEASALGFKAGGREFVEMYLTVE